jgi:hypothetical protein
LYEALQAGIKETDEISFKLLGLVPLVNGTALLAAVLGLSSSQSPAIVVLSLFGALVTLGLFWWELRNIGLCLWYISLAEHFEGAILGQVGVPDELRERPSAPGNVGKRRAEKLIYSTVILSWLLLPVMLLCPQALPRMAWVAYGVLAVGIVFWTVRALRAEVEPVPTMHRKDKL